MDYELPAMANRRVTRIGLEPSDIGLYIDIRRGNNAWRNVVHLTREEAIDLADKIKAMFDHV